MATVGKGVYARTVHTFFDALRSYDAATAASVFADDVDVHTPWGQAHGKEAAAKLLTNLVAPSLERPSFTIRDIAGDGNVTTLQVSVSGRFGQAARVQTWRILHLQGRIHQLVMA